MSTVRSDVKHVPLEIIAELIIAAIREQREPNSSVQRVLPCYRVLNELDRALSQAQR
jgi:2-hydroxy-4-carboxymuconate semialdehyde hemiacetal dehydrogenase